jgi:RNA polymerase sigma factor (sigma-70 family)
MNMSQQTVYVVDDDTDVGKAVAYLLMHKGFSTQVFTRPETFLESIALDGEGCAIVDLQMPNLSGLELQQKLHDLDIDLPVIFLTGHGDVPAATTSMKAGAIDFLQKPVDPAVLIGVVREALKTAEKLKQERNRRAEVEQLFAKLTPREREIVDFLAKGFTAREIGQELDISSRTVEIHRSRIMKKLSVNCVADLVALSIAYGLR